LIRAEMEDAPTADRSRRDYGRTSPPDDPADTRRPSASVIARAFPDVLPSFDLAPSTVTVSPTRTLCGDHRH
jgi:hypothetical protein